MSSQLVLLSTVPTGAVEVLFDTDSQPWFKRAHVGKFLDLTNILMSCKGLAEEAMKPQ